MNKRIRELAEQASHQSPDGYPVTIPYSKVFAKKFAELIVKECGVALNPPVQNRNVISRGQAYDLIKKHFGVEE